MRIRSVRPCRNMWLVVLQAAHKDRRFHLLTNPRLSGIRQGYTNGGIFRLRQHLSFVSIISLLYSRLG